jgi:hypothetical protein
LVPAPQALLPQLAVEENYLQPVAPEILFLFAPGFLLFQLAFPESAAAQLPSRHRIHL